MIKNKIKKLENTLQRNGSNISYKNLCSVRIAENGNSMKKGFEIVFEDGKPEKVYRSITDLIKEANEVQDQMIVGIKE